MLNASFCALCVARDSRQRGQEQDTPGQGQIPHRKSPIALA